MTKYRLIPPLIAFLCHAALYAGPTAALLPSTESDADSMIAHHVNAINGDYCETATYLEVNGPDKLSLQRTYNARNYMTGKEGGGWRMNGHLYLHVGKEKGSSSQNERPIAFAGEPSGSILTYSGAKGEELLTIDFLENGKGIANSRRTDISGKNNRQNQVLHCKDSDCELQLGDGTRRIYQKMDSLPSKFLGEELNPVLAAQMDAPSFYRLAKEILPSRNEISYAYDNEGHLSSMELTNPSKSKVYSWIRFSYEQTDNHTLVHAESSDRQSVDYELSPLDGRVEFLSLTQVKGSHFKPVKFDYQVKDHNPLLVKKKSSDQTLEIDYENGKVQTLSGHEGKPGTLYRLTYGNGYTDVLEPSGLKSRYEFDTNSRLTSIIHFDQAGHPYRIEQKTWEPNTGRLLAKNILDGEGYVQSSQTFRYDTSGNILEEETFLDISHDNLQSEAIARHHTFTYSADGLNLLLNVQDDQGNQIHYFYEPGTNSLAKEIALENGQIQRKSAMKKGKSFLKGQQNSTI